jgi:NADP-dependent 3-hydroxy acid dehydrogenase YdfG
MEKGDNTMSNLLKVALVTGAGSGIGRAVALGLMADGFTLVLAGRRPEPLQALAELAASKGHEALRCTDVSTWCSTTPGSTPLPCRWMN